MEYLRSWRRVLLPRRPPGRAARKERRFQAGRLVAVELPGVYNPDTSRTTRTLATGSGAVDATALGSIDLRMLPSASYAPVSS